MSNPRVVCNIGVWLTWVNVLTMFPRLLPQDGTEATGARAEAIAVVLGKAIPYTIALREYKLVCNR